MSFVKELQLVFVVKKRAKAEKRWSVNSTKGMPAAPDFSKARVISHNVSYRVQ